MALTERLALIVSMDAKGAVKGLTDIGNASERELGKADDRLSKVGRTASRIGVGMVGVGAVIGAALFKTAKASEDAEANTRKLENSIRNSSKLAGHSADEFTDLARAIQKKTAADADEIVGGESVLAQMGATADQIKGLTPLVVDLSRKQGIDLTSASKLVGKALDGNTGALKKAGVHIDEVAFKTDRYAAIQDALRKTVGGFAEQEGKTFAGSIERLKNQLGDLEEGVGKGAVDAFTTFLGPLTNVSARLSEMDPQTQANVGSLAAYSAAGLIAAGTTLTLVGKIVSARENFSKFADQMPRTAQGLSAVAKIAGAMALLQIGETIVDAVKPVDSANLSVLERDLLNFTTTGKASGEVAKSLGGNLGKLDDAIEEVAAPSNKTKLDHLTFGISSLGKDEHDLKQARQRINDLDGALASLANRDPAAASAALSALKAQMDPKAYQRLLPLLDQYNGTLAGVDTAGRLAAGGISATGDAAESTVDPITGLTQAETDLEDSMKKVLSATLAQFDSNLGYRQALDHTEEAVQAVSDAVRDHTTSSEEYRDALLTLESAQLAQAAAAVRQADDQATANGVTLTAGEKANIYKVELQKLADTLAPGSPLRAQLDGYIAQLDKVPLSKTTTLNLRLGTPLNESAKAKYPELFAPGKAIGGPVRKGFPYIVGEHRPELFVPDQDGSIIPQVPRTSSGSGYQSPAGATVNVYVTSNDPRAVVDAINQHFSRNGYAPIGKRAA